MNREEKANIVAECQEEFQKAKVAVFTDFRGLNVAQISKLRRDLRQAGASYRVVKNTLIERAVPGLDRTVAPNMFFGPTGVIYGLSDPVEPMKVVRDFAADNPSLKIKAAVLSGKVVPGAKALEIADLPSREVLLARVLAGMQAPIAGMLNVMQGNISKFLATLKAIEEKKAAQPA